MKNTDWATQSSHRHKDSYLLPHQCFSPKSKAILSNSRDWVKSTWKLSPYGNRMKQHYLLCCDLVFPETDKIGPQIIQFYYLSEVNKSTYLCVPVNTELLSTCWFLKLFVWLFFILTEVGDLYVLLLPSPNPHIDSASFLCFYFEWLARELPTSRRW